MANSDFGRGYSYCLGLFLAHTERKKVKYKGEIDYGLWFNGAGDHLYDFQAKSERDIKFRDRILHLRCEKATKEDFEWSIREAKDLLMEYDKSNGIEVIRGDYE